MLQFFKQNSNTIHTSLASISLSSSEDNYWLMELQKGIHALLPGLLEELSDCLSRQCISKYKCWGKMEDLKHALYTESPTTVARWNRNPQEFKCLMITQFFDLFRRQVCIHQKNTSSSVLEIYRNEQPLPKCTTWIPIYKVLCMPTTTSHALRGPVTIFSQH